MRVETLTVFDTNKGYGESIDFFFPNDNDDSVFRYGITELDEEDFYGRDNREVQNWRIN